MSLCFCVYSVSVFFFFFQAEDGIRDLTVTGVQTCALPISGRVERLTTIWTTPGFTDERIHLFWAADLTADKHAREPDEFIEVVQKPLSEALELIRSGVISDAKTALALLFVAGFVLAH